MSMSATPSVFESFNAKNLDPAQVARSFVPSDNFKRLAARRHSLIIGPRGSGKTTLLKMLQAEALDLWPHPEAEEYRSSIDFNGVFIPTDRVWKEQVDALNNMGFDSKDSDFFATAIFTTHVIYRLTHAFSYLAKNNEVNNQEELIGSLANLWGIELRSFSFRSLQSAALVRTSEILTVVGMLRRKDKLARDEIIGSPELRFMHLDVIQSLSTSVEIFNLHTSLKSKNWAFLFDELELAPNCVMQMLMDALRGTPERVILKLSMAPFTPEVSVVKDMFSPMPGHDHESILLWSAKKTGSNKEFSRQLLLSMLKEKGLSEYEPEQIFRKPTLVTHGATFQKSYDADPSFKAYLDAKGLEPNMIDKATGEVRNSVIRKVAPILKIRNLTRKHQNPGEAATMASLKALPSYYAGLDQLFDILEENPRWFIGVMNPLLDEFKRTDRRVSAERQLKEVKGAIEKFVLLLKTIPSPVKRPGSPVSGVEFTIDLIGNYFKKDVNINPFKDEPHGSFRVDNKIDASLQESLGAALNAGALVHVKGESEDIFMGDVRGQRFRLSYLLAPKYQLPLNLLKSISLTSILTSEKVEYESSLFDG